MAAGSTRSIDDESTSARATLKASFRPDAQNYACHVCRSVSGFGPPVLEKGSTAQGHLGIGFYGCLVTSAAGTSCSEHPLTQSAIAGSSSPRRQAGRRLSDRPSLSDAGWQEACQEPFSSPDDRSCPTRPGTENRWSVDPPSCTPSVHWSMGCY